MLFGGSSPSVSATPTLSTTTVHVSACAKSASGSSVYAVGPPPSANVCGPLTSHEIENAAALVVTDSLNVTEMVAFWATSTAFDPGTVLATVGAASEPVGPKFCGLPAFGPAKSVRLLSVSCVPPIRSNELSPFAPGVLNPVPSRHGLCGEPTPSTTVAAAVTTRMPAKLLAAKSVMPVPYVWSGATVPEYPGAVGLAKRYDCPGAEHHAWGHRGAVGRIAGASGRAALEGPARDVDRRRAGISQLDELVVPSRRSARAELGDDDAAR